MNVPATILIACALFYLPPLIWYLVTKAWAYLCQAIEWAETRP